METQEALSQLAYLQELVAQTRLRVEEGYPYFLLWGALWIVGYLGTIWLPLYLVWPVLCLLGGLISAVIGFKEGQKRKPVPPLLKKLGWLALILAFAAGGVFALLLTFTRNGRLLNAYWPFQVGVIYLATGVFMGRPMLFIGGWLVIVAVAGVFLPAPVHQIWLAVGGGGGLALTGVLLRKSAKKDG